METSIYYFIDHLALPQNKERIRHFYFVTGSINLGYKEPLIGIFILAYLGIKTFSVRWMQFPFVFQKGCLK